MGILTPLKSLRTPLAYSIGAAQYPVEITAYDDGESVGHFDTLFFPEGKSGYRYWHFFTPYPTSSRENPSVRASNNGVDLVLPSGVPDPVAPRDAVDQSDVDAIALPDGRVAMFYRENSPTKVFYKLTSDMKTWGDRVEALDESSASLTGVRSPALVVEADGTYTMWYTTGSGPYTVEYRTSSDLTNWSAATSCTIQTGVAPWHIDVVRVGTTYHMLLASNDPYRLYYLSSTDKAAWTGVDKPAIPLTGTSIDEDGHYRGTLVPRPGNPLVFDVWATGINTPTSDVFDANAEWRCLYFGSVNLSESRLDNYGYDTPHTLDPGFATVDSAVSAGGGRYYRVSGRGRISKVGMHVASSAGNISVAVYRGDPTVSGRDSRPLERIATTGEIACPGTNYREVALGSTVDVYPGDWIAISASDAGATFKSGSSTPVASDLGKGRAWFGSTDHPLPATVSTGSLTAFMGRITCLVGVE